MMSATEKTCEGGTAAAPTALAQLVCGNTNDGSALSTVLAHFSETISDLQKELPEPFGSNEFPHRLFGPFLAPELAHTNPLDMILGGW